MSEPLCPQCGSPMVIRTAKRGANAGGQFYGCTRFPKCRGTLPIDLADMPTPSTVESISSRQSSERFYPHTLIALSKRKGYQVRFFEAVGVPYGAFEKFWDTKFTDAQRRAFAQWRLDYPVPIKAPTWNERIKQVIAVAEKVLMRGRITLCSPHLEESFSQAFLTSHFDWDEAELIPEQLLASMPRNSESGLPESLESTYEELLYQRFFANTLGLGFEQWVMPQVDIGSLIQSSSLASSGRVDFLVCHPSIEKAIVVEVDGDQHQDHVEADMQRDKELQTHGYNVIRVPTSELLAFHGPSLAYLTQVFQAVGQVTMTGTGDGTLKLVHATRLAHQIQLSLIQAIKAGYLDVADCGSWNIYSDLGGLSTFNAEETRIILNTAVEDVVELLRNLFALYSIDLCKGHPNCSLSIPEMASSGIVVSYIGSHRTNLPLFEIQAICVPFHISNEAFPTSGAVLDPPDMKKVEYFLKYIFRKSGLWEGQYDAISRALQARDAIVLLPTGGGKSIAFQLASMLLPGRTIVIEPIISLIEDQLDNLASYGIDHCIGITSQIDSPLDRAKAIHLLGQGEYLFAYVAPERFQTVEFRGSLRALTVHTPVSVIVVDEAHCVSEWGHDFRTSYLNIGRTTRQFCESNGNIPPLLALTGTASRAVLKDVQRELQIEDFDAIITPKSFDRPELKFGVLRSSSNEKLTKLKGYLGQMLPNMFATSRATFYQPRGKKTYSGLVFCPWVNGEFGVVQVAEKIQSEMGIPTSHYSGKAPKYWSASQWGMAKQSVARKFKHNEIPLLVCTKAFGMGIDKPNIRYTIHYGLPGSIESFYQEAGPSWTRPGYG